MIDVGLRPITLDRVNDPVDIFASDDSRIYASILGTEGIHNIGSCMNCEPVGSNQFRISDGVASVQGHIAIIDPGDEELLTADAGVSGYNRIDLIVLDFETDGQDDTMSLKIIKGKQASTPTDPTFVKQDLTQGGTHRQVPLWRVKFEGPLIKTVERYTPVISNIYLLSKIIAEIIAGTQYVKNATNAYHAPEGLIVGSEGNRRVIEFWLDTNHKVKIFNTSTGFRITMYDAQGNFIRNILSSDLDGKGTVEFANYAGKADEATNATYAPNGFVVGTEDKPKEFNLWLGKNRRIKFTGNATDGFRIRLLDGDGNTIYNILSSDASGKGYVYEAQNATKLGNQPISYFATQIAMDHFQKYAQISHNTEWRISPADGFKMVSFSKITYPNGTPSYNILELTGNGYPRAKEAGIYEVWVDRIQTSYPVSLVINKMIINQNTDVCVSGHALIKMSAAQYFDISLAASTANTAITYANVSIRRVA